MTKASIVQKLLDNKSITAEEAVVLLKNDKVNIPMYTPNPYYVSPDWTGQPPSIECSNNSWEYPDTKYTPPSE